MSIDILPFEVLCEILGTSRDLDTIYESVLVCKAFKDAGLPSLYKTITLKTLQPSESGECFNFRALETLDKYPHLRTHVREVVFRFVLDDYVRRTRHTATTPLKRAEGNAWTHSLAQLPNVRAYTFYHVPLLSSQNQYLPIPSDVLEQTVSAIRDWGPLTELNLLYRLTRSDITRLSRIKKARSVRLGFPPAEAVGAIMPLVEQCDSLSIMDAYAIDSLVVIRPLVGNLSILHLGPHHALCNMDLLQMLQCGQGLQGLDLFYDNFLNAQTVEVETVCTPELKQLRKFVLRHQGVSNKAQYGEMFKWLDLVISAAPLSSFSIFSDDSRECNFAMPLITLLVKKPIEFLDIPHIIIRSTSLRMLFGTGNRLQVLSIMLVDVNVLNFFGSTVIGELFCNLSALYLRSNRVTCSYSLVTPQLRRTMLYLRDGPGHIRRVKQEKGAWKALWTEGFHTIRKGLDALYDEYGKATELNGW
ncbi:hypothetical protein D9757_004278 [Collybiopsis confluens]|uniref:F-box domain-containing protein n=1 Tax=Collybiopsis confluens TaxID=2823264 RepID=A0A8H5HTZ9_9AGAR|nr:hypothetical protein D9757_004278 [Collybiopsis confluens]